MTMELLTKAAYTDEMNEREKNNLSLAYRAACESIVLLKNNGVLPLKDRTAALYGGGALKTVKGGTGSGEVNERRSVSIYEGLCERGYNITSKAWLDDYELEYEKAVRKFEQKQKTAMLNLAAGINMMFANPPIPDGRKIKKNDVMLSGNACAIYVISRQAGEGGDRKLEEGDYYLTSREIENIKFCAENYKKCILIINSGACVDMSFADEIPGIDAILYICQLGTEGGHAVADILSGDAVPSGKLADTWAESYTDLPNAMEYSHLNGDTDNEYYKEGIYVGYRYFDAFGQQPRYPFGFGLSYTDFSLALESIKAEKTRIFADVRVKNTGKKFSGKETVQLYVSAPGGKLQKEYQSLAAFKKSSLLEPKKSEVLTLDFDLKDLASFRSHDASYVLEKGEYIIRIGTSSRDTVPAAALVLDEDAVVSKHAHICPVRSPFFEISAPERESEDTSALRHIELRAADIEKTVYSYKEPQCADAERAEEFVNTLSVKEMIDIVVGTGQFGGDERFILPGSVGNTTSKFWDRGLANAALCDGPAGLRIQRTSTVNAKGKVKPVEMPISFYKFLPSVVQKAMTGDPEKETVLYQFTTAFPVAAALAQTWNTELTFEIGSAILAEMREYGCTYWLAPAINIHRNPLCGRNFEYFSEDPFLTGTLAAALIKGVQQEEGYYVTIKHFACNNQEENRNAMSSNVTERTLREIYLKAFEICVKTANAKAVMTSYNKLNGVLAPTSHDLNTKVLRNEWGFDGVVMTDWHSTARTKGASALALRAGNDLIMPGGMNIKLDITAGLRHGLVSEDELRRCCINVVKQILNSNIQKEYIDK